MSSPRLEAFLARLYVERAFRSTFLADPLGVARRAGLAAAECEALVAIDREGLALAAASFEHKRVRSNTAHAHASRAPGPPRASDPGRTSGPRAGGTPGAA